MARRIIDIGAIGNDGTGDSIRDSFRKVNDNFRELYSSLGLGDNLTFVGLDDTPDNYNGQNDPTTGNTPVVTINNTESGLQFKKLIPGNGISIDFTTNPNEIKINSDFAEISADATPQLGGDLSMRSGGNQYRIYDAGTNISPLQPIFRHELVNKNYADTKISRFGVNAINPETNQVDQSFGRMSGPLILSRDPEPEDDTLYDGLVAATKRYVDNSAFGSSVNLYVALSGEDERPGVSKSLQGRALAYAYRTLEAACKRAEELVNEARLELGPYKKVLTYNNGAGTCTLDKVEPAPGGGSGFAGELRMSVDEITLNAVGTNYYVGDVLELAGGSTGSRCTIEVLSTLTTPGAILTFRIISTGSYTVLPGSTSIPVTIIESAAPPSVGAIGVGATFNITYKVNSVRILTIAEDGYDGRGSGYSLVSVRIVGGGGTGAFGTAVVTGGQITSVTINDRGTGFTSLPTLEVDLPRFLITTEGYRTDFTGDVTTTTPETIRGRDIREGLFLRGEDSGALAQILSHSGALDSEGREIFDVDIKYGAFQEGEAIAYGDIQKNIQITILVESGEYYENYPIKIPANCSVVGDEFRRCIFRPKHGTSSSPWAFQKFRRDKIIDGLTVTSSSSEYGYHYLTDPNEPVYPKIQNKGDYVSAATLLDLNRSFLQEELIAWINNNVENNIAPFIGFTYDQRAYKRDIGQIVDSIVFDLKYSGYNRTISKGIKLRERTEIITTELFEYLALLTKFEDFAQDIIENIPITGTQQDLYPQIIDAAYDSEVGSSTVITLLVNAIKDIIDESAPGFGSVNQPKNSEELDVFLANDAVRWQAISAQGHGGFMGVLDPEGQILAKSPYFQECASFSRSKDRQVFAGGMFVDGFAGNLEFNIDNVVTPTRLEVSDLDRFPQLPCSFIVGDSVYRVNYIRDYEYNANGSTATFILDETTPWNFPVFVYDSAACYRDVGLILDGLGYDILFGTNFWTRQNGLTYRLSQSAVVIEDQRTITLEAINYAHELVNEGLGLYPTIQNTVDLSNATIADIIERGTAAAPTLTFTLPSGVSSNVTNAYNLLMANRDYIVAEINGWVQAQIAGNIAPWTSGDVYNASRLQSDIRFITEAAIHDLIYGGNAATRLAALKFYNNLTGALVLSAGFPARYAAAIAYLNYLTGQVAQNLAPAVTYSTLSRTTGSAGSAAEAATLNTLLTAVANATSAANYVTAQTFVTLSAPSTSGYSANATAARNIIQSVKTSVQQAVVDYVDFNGNRYELLAPGNRSMLANDYTQINDMGYGAIAINGGLIELVSVFTYYCYTSYYSVTGGQIRSVGGSTAHGIYALVAEGADPLEVPTPTSLYEELSQGVTCYYPTPTYANTQGGLFIYVTNYEYIPLGSSELEILHTDTIFRYPVTSVTTQDLPAGVVRLNLTTGTGGTTQGLFDVVPDGTKMTLRMSSQVLLTGGLEDVAVRPSTGLKLRETSDVVYRVLAFNTDSDENGPYEILTSLSTPTIFKVLTTVTTIQTNVCTTSQNHKLRIGDKFIPTSTSNGLSSGTTYYIIEIPAYNQFKVSVTPGGLSATLVNGSGLTIKGVKTHKLLENYTIDFSTTGTLPAPLDSANLYYVLANDLTDTEFSVSDSKGGLPVSITTTGSGTHRYNIDGLTLTQLRENYNYIDLTVYNPGDYVTSGSSCTISIGSPAEVTLASHGFTGGEVIKFTTTGTLPTGMFTTTRYFVLSAGITLNTFRFSATPGGTPVDTTGSAGSGHSVGLVTGRQGDTTFAVVPVGTVDIPRVAGSKFVFRGEEYVVSTYQPESVTLLPYARIVLNRALVNPINNFSSSYTIKSAVPIRSSGSLGTLTIRISLTRCTSHDLLEIGTGSYADTNYPKEIYGPSVNAITEATEVAERDVGRVFYVTTDQYGNFKVGPYFKVDQGTGQVTFSSSIALSNLDGLGFKIGVPIREFSTDTGFTDNATDSVPTENAARGYIERRLGVTHDGAVVDVGQLIPTITGGFMPLSGILAMKGPMDLGNYKITNVADPVASTDAVNLRSLTFGNLQEFTLSNVQAGDVLIFSGQGNEAQNARVVGDISIQMDSTAFTIDAQIQPGVIVNNDISASAGIVQSKLSMNSATTRANATGITQADRGLASFDSGHFDVTDGWVTIKNNSVLIGDLQQIATKTVLGNSSLTNPNNVTQVPFSTVVNDGGAIKKLQYSSVGFLRRTSGTSFSEDADYTIVQGSAGSSNVIGANEIIIRDGSGDFGGRTADLQSIKIDNNLAIDTGTIATGGFVRYYGYGSAGGILIQDSTLPDEKKTLYWNNSHEFKTQNGLSAAPITASAITVTSVQATAITTGSSVTAGTITGRWTLTGTSPNESRLQATYSADLAENYEGDKEYEVGTVLVFGGDKEVTTTNIKGDTRVAGVVSNTAAYTMYEACPGLKNLVALQGRVPCKVVGKIQKGDILITAGIPGVAIAATGDVKVGTVVGKALVDYDSDHIGMIEIAVGRT
jgi:hypothetical protein